MKEIKIHFKRLEKCKQGKHKPKENDSGNTFCVTCGLLFDNRKTGVRLGESLKEEDKVIVSNLEGFKEWSLNTGQE